MAGFDDSVWQRKGATLSDKTARKEYGLIQDEIVKAIRAGKLQYRMGSMHGNPYLKLVRSEVEALVKRKHGGDQLQAQKQRTELASINRELRKLRKQVTELEARKQELVAALGK